MPKFDKTTQKFKKYNKNDRKHTYVLKVLHNGIKQEDRDKMMAVVFRNQKNKEGDSHAFQK